MIEIDAKMGDWKRFTEQVEAMGARGVRFAISDLTTVLAKGAHKYYPKYLGTKLTVRNKSFVRSRFGFKGGRPSNPKSYAFSKKKDNFTGWTENQRGGDTRKRFGTRHSRGKSRRKQMKRVARLNPGVNFLNIQDISGTSTNQQLAKMLVGLRMKGQRGPFIAGDVGGGGNHMPWGVWTMGNLSKRYADHPEYRSLTLLQKFESPADTQRMDWAGGGAQKYIAQEDIRGEWMRAYARAWRKATK